MQQETVRVQMTNSLSKLVALRNAKDSAKKRTEAAREARAKKIATRHERGEYNVKDVRHWFEKACKEHTALSRLPSWRPKDRENARRLLAEFGGETLKETTFWFFEHWESYVAASRGKLNGIPTPSLMIAMKSQVFVDCELNRVPGVDTSKKDRVRGSEWSDDTSPALDPSGWGLD